MARKSDTPRVVGFDFGPPAAMPSPPPAAAAENGYPAAPAENGYPAAAPAPGYPAPPAAPTPGYAAPPAAAAPGYPAAAPGYPEPPAGHAPAAPAYPAPGYPSAEPYGAPVATGTVPAYGAAPGYPPPGAFPPPVFTPPAPEKRHLRGRTAIAAAVVTVLVAGGMVREIWDQNTTTAPPAPAPRRVERVALKRPATLGSVKRLTTAEARKAERDVVAKMPRSSQAIAGIYGRGGVPTYLMLAAYSGEPTSRATLNAFATGWKSEDGKVGRAAAMPGNVACATVSVRAMRGAVCAWASAKSNGVVLSYLTRDLRALAKVTVQARAAVSR